jgi:hypothetical protein
MIIHYSFLQASTAPTILPSTWNLIRRLTCSLRAEPHTEPPSTQPAAQQPRWFLNIHRAGAFHHGVVVILFVFVFVLDNDKDGGVM